MTNILAIVLLVIILIPNMYKLSNMFLAQKMAKKYNVTVVNSKTQESTKLKIDFKKMIATQIIKIINYTLIYILVWSLIKGVL